MKTRKYLLAAPPEIDNITDYVSWVWPALVFDDPTNPHFYITTIGEFELDGICTNPDAVEVTP